MPCNFPFHRKRKRPWGDGGRGGNRSLRNGRYVLGNETEAVKIVFQFIFSNFRIPNFRLAISWSRHTQTPQGSSSGKALQGKFCFAIFGKPKRRRPWGVWGQWGNKSLSLRKLQRLFSHFQFSNFQIFNFNFTFSDF